MLSPLLFVVWKKHQDKVSHIWCSLTFSSKASSRSWKPWPRFFTQTPQRVSTISSFKCLPRWSGSGKNVEKFRRGNEEGTTAAGPQRIQSCRNWSLIAWNWYSRLENDFKRLGLWKKPKLCLLACGIKKAYKTTYEVFSPKLKMNLIKSLEFMV